MEQIGSILIWIRTRKNRIVKKAEEEEEELSINGEIFIYQMNQSK